jgi:hypothetical protein
MRERSSLAWPFLFSRSLLLLNYQSGGEFDRFNHAPVIGDAFTGNVERSAVIHGCSYYGQTESHVHCFSKGEAFYRNQALVVIASRNCIELTAPGAKENGVRGKGPGYINAVQCSAFGDCRLNLIALFGPEQPVFAGVRVQPRNRNLRSFDSKPLKFTIGNDERVYHVLSGNGRYRLQQAGVDRQKENLQVACEEAHQRAPSAAQFRQHFGVARMYRARELQRLFVNWGGGDRVEATCLAEPDRCLNSRDCLAARSRGETAGGNALDAAADVVHDGVKSRSIKFRNIAYDLIVAGEAERSCDGL